MSFDDPDEERTWLVDVTFLESGWQCIFGPGLRRGAHRALPRARAGLLFLWSPFHRRGRRPPGRGGCIASDRRAMAVRDVSAAAGRALAARKGPAHHHPARGRRLHLPQSPRVRGRRRLRPAQGGARYRCRPAHAQARRAAGSCRCAATRASGRTGTSRRRSASGSDGTGAAAAQTSLGGARSHRTRSSGPNRSIARCGTSCGDDGRDRLRRRRRLSRRPPPVGRHVRARCRPPGTGPTPCGSARQGRRPARLGFGAAGVSPQVAGSPAWRARPLSERGAPLPLLRPRALRTRRGTTKHVARAADGRTPGTVRPAPRTRASDCAPPRIAGVDLFSRVAPS